MSSLLVHIGYHKTGTAWLQQEIFGGGAVFQRPWPRRTISRLFVTVRDLEFCARATAVSLAQQRERPSRSGAIDVLSHERLSGNPHSGGYDSRVIADRLYLTLPQARVLIVIRRQAEMILSSYKQYVRIGGTRSLRGYVDAPGRGATRIPQFSLAHFEYDRLISYYHQSFGPAATLVLPYELLASDPYAFVSRIAIFAGVDPPVDVPTSRRNVSLSAVGVAIKRPLNFLFARDTVNPSAPFDSPKLARGLRRAVERVDRALPTQLRAWSGRRLLAEVNAVTAGRFVESNHRTAELTGLDLAAFGYEL
ncbi:MAG: sulfotransferase [Egibacteraceae bacterium]